MEETQRSVPHLAKIIVMEIYTKSFFTMIPDLLFFAVDAIWVSNQAPFRNASLFLNICTVSV